VVGRSRGRLARRDRGHRAGVRTWRGRVCASRPTPSCDRANVLTSPIAAERIWPATIPSGHSAAGRRSSCFMVCCPSVARG
jgi:hypothetical protein